VARVRRGRNGGARRARAGVLAARRRRAGRDRRDRARRRRRHLAGLRRGGAARRPRSHADAGRPGRDGRRAAPPARLPAPRPPPDLHDYALRAGAQMRIFGAGWFDLSGQLAFEVAGTENSVYDGTALRTDVSLLAGHYGRRWFAVAEVGYDRAWLTYIENTSW